jgi:hypothetical protein
MGKDARAQLGVLWMINDVGRGTFTRDAALLRCEDGGQEEDPRRMAALRKLLPITWG